MVIVLGVMIIWNNATLAQDTSAQDLYIQGRNLALEGELEEAIKVYSEALALDPNLIEALYWRGIAYSNKQHLTTSYKGLRAKYTS
jgi:tetratricopeptide (TPR) repeat protein